MPTCGPSAGAQGKPTSEPGAGSGGTADPDARAAGNKFQQANPELYRDNGVHERHAVRPRPLPRLHSHCHCRSVGPSLPVLTAAWAHAGIVRMKPVSGRVGHVCLGIGPSGSKQRA